MKAWLHDGTLDGFLCALAGACEDGEPPDDVAPAASWPASLFAREIRVPADAARAKSFLSGVRERAGPDAARRVVYGFLSERRDLARPLWEYVRLGRRMGPEVDLFHAHVSVAQVHLVSSRVGGEAHRLKGLLRFRRLAGGAFWAPCEPEYRVIGLVALHFRRRMPDADWIVHDLRRRVAVRWDRRELREIDAAALAEEAAPLPAAPGGGRVAASVPLAGDEARYEALWREFYRRIAIPGRLNARLQRRFMPRRYWRYLLEKAPKG